MSEFLLYVPGILTGPVLSIFLLWLYWQRRGQMSRPPIFAATVLALTSVATQLGVSTVTIVSGFNEIAQQKATGPGAVAAVFIDAQHAIVSGLLGFASCVVVTSLFAAALRSTPNQSVPIFQSSVSARTLAWSAGALFGTALLLWYQGRTLDMCMVFVDPQRLVESKTRFGTTNLGDLATIVTRRLAIVGLTAKIMPVALIIIGFRWFNSDQPRRRNFVAETLLATIALGWCGLNTAIGLKNLKYLRSVGVTATTKAPAD
jgi:hypothetical protein